MKVEITDEHGLIDNARFAINSDLTASVYIETKERWAELVSTGSCQHIEETYIEFNYDNARLDGLTQEDYNTSQHHMACVKIIAETQRERMILDRLRFELHDKYSQWFLLIEQELL